MRRWRLLLRVARCAISTGSSGERLVLSAASVGVLAGLFGAAFLAATIVPAQSEAVLIAAALGTTLSPWLLLAVASVGNVLGSVVNWALGRGIARFRDRPWFPVSAAALERAERWYQRFGVWSLLASFVPIIGDPLTVVAGVLRVRLIVFVTLVAIAKTTRYAVLLWGLDVFGVRAGG
jgi:membrane protein YqaA with SNARE-associated domain